MAALSMQARRREAFAPRKAARAELGPLAQLLTDAFMDDPVLQWTLREGRAFPSVGRHERGEECHESRDADDPGSQLLRGEDQCKGDRTTKEDQFSVPAQEQIVSVHDATNRDFAKRHD